MFRLIYHATYDNEYQVEIKIALYCIHTIFIIVNLVIWNIKQHLKDDFYWDQDDQCSKFQNYIYCDCDIILTAVMHDVKLHLCRSAVQVDLITHCQSPPSCTECHKCTKTE